MICIIILSSIYTHKGDNYDPLIHTIIPEKVKGNPVTNASPIANLYTHHFIIMFYTTIILNRII